MPVEWASLLCNPELSNSSDLSPPKSLRKENSVCAYVSQKTIQILMLLWVSQYQNHHRRGVDIDRLVGICVAIRSNYTMKIERSTSQS